MKINCWKLGLALLATATIARAAESPMLTVAVFDFESKDEAVRDLGPKVATLINATLSAEANLITVERAELEKVLGEQELGLSGTVSADTAAKDLGVLNIAGALPFSAAPAVAPLVLVLGGGSYQVLYAVAGACAVVAAAAITRVRQVR